MGVRLSGRALATSVCTTDKPIIYTWTSDIPGLSLTSQTAASLYVRGPMAGTITPGTTYTFTLTGEAAVAGLVGHGDAVAAV